MLTYSETARLQEVAAVLLPGDGASPAAASLPELPALLARAVSAIGREEEILHRCIAALPAAVDWYSLEAFADANAADFDVLSAVVAGAYFMAPAALDAIGYPRGPRRAPRLDQAVDELSSGVLDPVLGRASMVRAVCVARAEEINEC